MNQHHSSINLFWMSPKELSWSLGSGALGFSASSVFCSNFLFLITWFMKHFPTLLQIICIYTSHIYVDINSVMLHKSWNQMKNCIIKGNYTFCTISRVIIIPCGLGSLFLPLVVRRQVFCIFFFSSQSCHRAPFFHTCFNIIWPLQNLVTFQWFLCRLLLSSLCMWFIPKYDLTAVEI